MTLSEKTARILGRSLDDDQESRRMLLDNTSESQQSVMRSFVSSDRSSPSSSAASDSGAKGIVDAPGNLSEPRYSNVTSYQRPAHRPAESRRSASPGGGTAGAWERAVVPAEPRYEIERLISPKLMAAVIEDDVRALAVGGDPLAFRDKLEHILQIALRRAELIAPPRTLRDRLRSLPEADRRRFVESYAEDARTSCAYEKIDIDTTGLADRLLAAIDAPPPLAPDKSTGVDPAGGTDSLRAAIAAPSPLPAHEAGGDVRLIRKVEAPKTGGSFREEIESFSKLPVGWDSYDAQPPSAVAIRMAIDFLETVQQAGLEINWVAPTNDDSILVHLDVRDGAQEWDFYSDGDIAVTSFSAAGGKKFLDVTSEQIEAVLAGKYGEC